MDSANNDHPASPASLADPDALHQIDVQEDGDVPAAVHPVDPPGAPVAALPPAFAGPSWPLRVHAQLEPTSTGSRNYFSLVLPPALSGFIGAQEYAHSLTRINLSILKVQRQRLRYGLLSVGLLVLVVVLNQKNQSYSGTQFCDDDANPCRMSVYVLCVFVALSLLWIVLKDLGIKHTLTHYFPRSVQVESELMYERSPRVMELIAMGARPAQMTRPWPIQWRGSTFIVPRPPFSLVMDVEIEVGAPFAQQVDAPLQQHMQL